MTVRLSYETYSFYIAPFKGLQGDVEQYAANQTRNTGVNPILFMINVLGILRALLNGFTKDEAT